MSVADSLRLISLEATLVELAGRVEALEKLAGSRQGTEAPAEATPPASLLIPPTERPSSTPTGDAVPVLGKREIGIEGGKPGPGRGHKTVRNPNRLPSSQTAAYTLARLDRDRPDLAQRVRTKEISAHAAATEAGFRRKRMTAVPADADAARRSGELP